MKKEVSLFDRVRNLRNAVRGRIRDETLSEYEEALKEGKYPWEGMWLTPGQITLVQEKLKKRDKIVFLELLVFLLFLGFFVLPMVSSFTVAFMPSQNGKGNRNIFKDVVQQSPSSSDFKETKVSRASGDINGSSQFMENQRGKINAHMLKLRGGPGTHYTVISRLKYGEPVTVKEKNGTWLKITTDSSLVGWVSGEYIKLIGLSGRKDLTSNHDEGRKSPEVLSTAEKSDESLKSETPANPGEKVSQNFAGQVNRYYVQIGAWKKFDYAQEVMETLKARYPDIFIEYKNSIYRVKIPEILDKKHGALILKEIRENFNLSPLLVRKRR